MFTLYIATYSSLSSVILKQVKNRYNNTINLSQLVFTVNYSMSEDKKTVGRRLKCIQTDSANEC